MSKGHGGIPSQEEERKGMAGKRGTGDERVCCLGMKPPSILLRNMIIPKSMWDAFPNGLTLSITDHFLYQPACPTRPNAHTITKPSTFALPYEQVWITTEDNVRLYAFLIKQNDSSSSTLPTLIFFHGNAGSIEDRLDNAKLLHDAVPMNILLVEYRGYGPSEGRPSERGLYRDGFAALAWAKQQLDLNPEKIFIFGRSLGGAVAIDICSRKDIKVAGCIVENTFTSIPSLAVSLFEGWLSWLKYVPNWCYGAVFDNKKKVQKMSCPTLFISSNQDELIPQEMMGWLHKGCGSRNKKLLQIDAGHNDAYEKEGYVAGIHSFIQAALSLRDDEIRYGTMATLHQRNDPIVPSKHPHNQNVNVDENNNLKF